jgi:recombination protein RecT
MVGTIQKAAENKAALVEKKKPSAMQDYIKSMEKEIAKALPSVITPERFTRITLSALSANPKLAQTTPQSFLAAMMNAAQLGVEPNTPLGQAYLIPYLNKGVLECQFQLGYKGLIDLAHRSGEIISIEARVVYENDEFDFEYGLHSDLKHKPAKADRGEPIWFYALFKTKDGGSCFEVSSVEDIRQHAKKYSQSYTSAYSPWTKNFEEMAKKTVLKAVLKYAPLKSDFVRALASDETIKTQIDKDMYEVPAAYVEADYSVTEESNQPAVENGQEYASGEISNS